MPMPRERKKEYYSHPWSERRHPLPVPPAEVIAARDARYRVGPTPIEKVLGDRPANYPRADQRIAPPVERINRTLGTPVTVLRRPYLTFLGRAAYTKISLSKVSIQDTPHSS